MPGLYLILTPVLKIVAVSNAYLQATKTRREDVLGRNLFDVFPDNPDDPTATGTTNLGRSLETVIKDGVANTMAVQKYDIRRPESEGGGFEERFWSPINSPVFGTDGKVAYIVHRVEDVTDFIRLKDQRTEQSKVTEALRIQIESVEGEIYKRAQEIQEVNNQLLKANQELETFSYSVSHDLRTPLRAIDGFAKILSDESAGKLDEKEDRLLGVIRRNVQNMGRIIDALLSFSRLSRQEMGKSKLDMNKLTNQVWSEISNDPKRNISISILVLPQAYGDRDLIFQVLSNLLANAIKYTGKTEQASIEVGGKEEKDHNLFWVKDNGAGFDMEHAKNLFGVFRRLHRPDEFEGNGVGLAIVHRIITRHGGKIWADAKPNNGATFFFTLPSDLS